MYGAMGSGGGNAWMKIMGIDQDKVKGRQTAKEKEKKGGGGGVDGKVEDKLGLG